MLEFDAYLYALVRSTAAKVAKKVMKDATVYSYKGSKTVEQINALSTKPEVGDVYNISNNGTVNTYGGITVSAGDNIAFTDNDTWDKLSADNMDGKVDKVEGMGLSHNDYTDADKEKVENAYEKPVDGIPVTDLEEEAQQDLGKAHNSISEEKVMSSLSPLNETSSLYIKDAIDGDVVNYKIYGKSVQEKLTGKNLFDVSSVPTSNAFLNGLTPIHTYDGGSLIDGVFHLDRGTGSTNYWINKAITLDAGTYTLSVYAKAFSYPVNQGLWVCIFDDGANKIGGNSKSYTLYSDYTRYKSTFTLNAQTTIYLQIETQGTNGLEFYFKDIQLEAGSSATEYEPYNNGVAAPTPTNPVAIQSVGDLVTAGDSDYLGHEGKYRIPIEVIGKNKLPLNIEGSDFANTNIIEDRNGITLVKNADGSYTANGTASKETLFYLSVNTPPYLTISSFGIELNKSYVLSGFPETGITNMSSNSSLLTLHRAGEGSGNIQLTPATPEVQFSTYSDFNVNSKMYLLLHFATGVKAENAIIKPQIEEGTVATEYQPYHHQLFNLYLDEPLRSIRSGDDLVADYVDFKNGQVIRKVTERAITAIEYTNPNYFAVFSDGVHSDPLQPYQVGNNPRYGLYLSFRSTDSLKMKVQPHSKSNGLISHFRVANSTLSDSPYAVMGWQSNVIYFIISDTDMPMADKADYFTDILNVSPIKLCYELAEPYTETITPESIELVRGINTLSVNTFIPPSKTKIVYHQYITDTVSNSKLDMMLSGFYPHDSKLLNGKIVSEVSLISGTEHTGVPAFPYISHSAITALDLPNATQIGEGAFYGLGNISSLSAPNLKQIGSYAFINMNLPNTELLDLPELTSVGFEAFRGSLIKNINVPKLTRLAFKLFANNTVIEHIELPSVNIADSAGGAFYGCTALKTVVLSILTSLPSQTFYGCTSLEKLVLKANTVVTLANTNAFDGISNRITVYVPSSLISSYQSSSTTNWYSLYTNDRVTFVAIEGSEFE